MNVEFVDRCWFRPEGPILPWNEWRYRYCIDDQGNNYQNVEVALLFLVNLDHTSSTSPRLGELVSEVGDENEYSDRVDRVQHIDRVHHRQSQQLSLAKLLRLQKICLCRTADPSLAASSMFSGRWIYDRSIKSAGMNAARTVKEKDE